MISLEARMREYEDNAKTYLIKRMPVIVRIDGIQFSHFTRHFDKPFDEFLGNVMHQTMLELCKDIPGCVLGYTQSDEITLVLCDYQTLETSAWLNNAVEKLCSRIASMATSRFNRIFAQELDCKQMKESFEMDPDFEKRNALFASYQSRLWQAEFDVRVFNLPKEEVANNLYWRQKDASRNSISNLGRAYYSHRELDLKNQSQIQDMLIAKGVNWNDLDTWKKRGCCAIKEIDEATGRGKWKLDLEIPIFSKDWDYIQSRIEFQEGD